MFKLSLRNNCGLVVGDVSTVKTFTISRSYYTMVVMSGIWKIRK